MRILSIAGTRPEAIKFAPLVRMLDHRPGVEHRLIATGQHGSAFHQALAWFGLAADHDLALANPDPDSFAEALGIALPRLIRHQAPDLVLVQGDTTSAWATALTVAAMGVPVGHVEAGLRSGNPRLPWPEERNRREIDGVSTLLFAPCAAAAANLIGLPGRTFVTGNTGIDALFAMRDRLPITFHDSARKLILVTCHRREAIQRLPDLAAALIALADRSDVDIVLPAHGNPAIGGPLRILLGGHPRITIERPMPYAELIRLMDCAHLLLTDSGGLQEEAPALGLPALILRDVTERPEAVASGNARLVGLDPARIVAETMRLLDDPHAHAAMSRPAFPYGRGDAAPRIADAILDWFGLPSASLLEPIIPTSYA
jgi:UDP-N-acetylglucosamine 2-epimerase (non-hydrolysing)